MSRRSSILKAAVLPVVLGCMVSCRSRSPDPPPPPPLPTPAPVAEISLPLRGNSVTDFGRLANWEVKSDSGSAALSRNPIQSIWGRGSAQIDFDPRGKGPHRITLTPDAPWRIPSQFDTILLWIQQEGDPWIREDHFIQLQYRDVNGLAGEWTLPYQPRKGWQMLHVRVEEPIPYPVTVESLQWVLPDRTDGPRTLLLDSLSIYQEVLGRIPKKVDYVRPHGYAPAFAPQRKNSVTLDFPTGPFAYRPQTRPERSMQTLTATERETFEFQYKSPESTIGYRITATPGFPKVDVSVDGQVIPDAWSGMQLPGTAKTPELRFARTSENRLDLQYTQGLQFVISLHGKTLQIEISSLLESIQALDLGRIDGQFQPIWLPFMRLAEDRRWPVFVYTGFEAPVLLSVLPDWWFSLGSRHSVPDGAASANGHAPGRIHYEKRWRGSLNMFRERLYVTASRRLQDVLPSPASPRALFSGDIQPVGAGEFDRKAFGFREMNVLSIHPLEAEWEDGLLARTPSGEWRTHPQEGYVLKTGRLDGLPLQRLQSAGAEGDSSYLWVPAPGRFPPWRFTDSDVRMIGAGTFTQTLAEVGAFLQQATAEWGGPLLSRGGSEWLWAGLVSAFVPDFPHGLMELHPLLPQFAWRNVHPFSRILGLGELKDFRLPTEENPEEETLLNRCLAFQLAYAAPGKIPEINRPNLRKRAQRFSDVLHRHLHGQEVDRIAYWTGERFVDAAEALQQNVLEKSQLYIRLQDQTEIWINGDFDSVWRLRVDGRELSLPPFGFALRSETLFVLNKPQWNGQPGSGLIKESEKEWTYSSSDVTE